MYVYVRKCSYTCMNTPPIQHSVDSSCAGSVKGIQEISEPLFCAVSEAVPELLKNVQ